METVEISVAVVTYRVDGARRKAFSGDVIEVDAAEAARLRSIGAVAETTSEADDDETEPDEPVTESDDDEPAAEPVERPKQAAPKTAWVDYAIATGMDRAEAEALDKRELIAALA